VKIDGYKDEVPCIYPDYVDAVIPSNIAPLNFKLNVEAEDTRVLFELADTDKFEIAGKDHSFNIPMSQWKDLLQKSMGKSISVTIKVKEGDKWMAYKPFSLHVAKDSIDSDLHMIDLSSGTSRTLSEINSEDVESYHSWSSNSRWFVFSSRRMDGLYTHPYIAHIDENGEIGKPFVLPQEEACFYSSFMQSFNIPEFVTSEVETLDYQFVRKVNQDKGIDIKFE